MALRISNNLFSGTICTSRALLMQRAYFATTPSRRIDPIGEVAEGAVRLATGIVIDDVANALPSSSSSSSSSNADNKSTKSSPSQQQKTPAAADPASPSLLPYHISRTPANRLPVYHDTRNGNMRKETIIRKITGDARPLRDAVKELLGVEAERVWIGKVTGHVYVKGHHKSAIEKFLASKGF